MTGKTLKTLKIDLNSFDENRIEPPILTSPRSLEACRKQVLCLRMFTRCPLRGRWLPLVLFICRETVHTHTRTKHIYAGGAARGASCQTALLLSGASSAGQVSSALGVPNPLDCACACACIDRVDIYIERQTLLYTCMHVYVYICILI